MLLRILLLRELVWVLPCLLRFRELHIRFFMNLDDFFIFSYFYGDGRWEGRRGERGKSCKYFFVGLGVGDRGEEMGGLRG